MASGDRGSPTVKRFKAMLDSSDLLDFTLFAESAETKQPVRIGVHKAFLAAQSEKFREMMTSDTRKRRRNECKVNDITAETLRVFVEYLYGAKLSLTKDVEGFTKAMEYFASAEVYQVASLRQECLDFLIENASLLPRFPIDVTFRCFLFAEKYSCVELTQRIIRIVTVYFKKYTNSDQFFDLAKETPKLVREVAGKVTERNEHSIELEVYVDDIERGRKVCSPVRIMEGFKWYLMAKKDESPGKIGLLLHCAPADAGKEWFCEARVHLRALRQAGGAPLEREYHYKYCSAASGGRGFSMEMLNPALGFIDEDGDVKFQAVFTIVEKTAGPL